MLITMHDMVLVQDMVTVVVGGFEGFVVLVAYFLIHITQVRGTTLILKGL